MPASYPKIAAAPARQRGIVLLIALIMLVAMTLVGISMLRSIGVGAGVAGNLAFKQNATSVADLGVEVARSWVINTGLVNPSALDADDIAANGYYASWMAGFDPLTYDWRSAKKLQQADAPFLLGTGRDDTGNEVRYVLHRLCLKPGSTSPLSNPGQECANYSNLSALSSKGGISYGGAMASFADQPYYRVTVRVSGPRNSTSYVQVVMY